jgi:DNA helicase HerA-like ATPase
MAGTTTVLTELKKLATVDIFGEAQVAERFVGRPFYLDYDRLRILSNDKWKNNVGGVPAGAFLLCVYGGEPDVKEAILVRVLRPTKLPSDDDVVASMVDYYKESIPTDVDGKLDSYTRAEFQFSGLECRVIGTFYTDQTGATQLAGDLDNFYSPHNYRVYKPSPKALEYIVNFREEGIPQGRDNERIGVVRYSSSLRHAGEVEVPVYVSPFDFLGKRTALFGMTRTGKSNTVKKIIQATATISAAAPELEGEKLKPIGQIIFDVNGEYANENQQDAGTAIFKQYADVTRYSVLEKPGFKVMKLNFYRDVDAGYGLLASLLGDDSADYTRAFCSIDWEKPDPADKGATTRYDRRVAAYKACLYAAGFRVPSGERVKFTSSAEIRSSKIPGLDGVEPSKGLTLEDAQVWFNAAWDNYRDGAGPFEEWKQKNGGREWADDDLQTLMRFLTRKSKPGGSASESGFRKLVPARELHTDTVGQPFEEEIVELLRSGKIVIIDLSQGDPEIQRTYSDRVCRKIFSDAIARFIRNEPANFIQMYFEEAHNLFPRKEEKDLTLIYNRLAKEGQKLRLGMNYATQEVSSISSSILKNTQNWFVSHLNNQDELREVQKYYDFEDFTDSLRRTIDKGFIRMKTDSNPFIVPVQIDRFVVAET